MIRTSKLELYVISAAVILSLFVISIFWAFNRGQTPKYTAVQPTPTGTSKPLDSGTTPDSTKSKQGTVAYQGLAKLIEPSAVPALVFGDAVAESLGASNKEQTSWTTLVANDLKGKYPGTLEWHFKTTAEGTINNGLNYLPEATQATGLIILCFGGNDWATLTTDDFKQKYEQLLAELKIKSPNANVFLVVEPPVKSIETNNKSFPYRQVIMDLGQKYQLPIINGWSAFINDPAPLSDLLVDGVNPNDQGYRVFANEVLKKFNESLATQS